MLYRQSRLRLAEHVVCMALILCSTARAADRVSDIASAIEPGPYETSLTETRLFDHGRNKPIPTRITYPNGEGEFPVIIWIHGAGDTYRSAPDLARHWASHGFIVVQGQHYWTEQPPRRVSLVRTIRELRRVSEGGPVTWRDRTQDVSFLIDSLTALAEETPEATPDTSRVGVGGHSYGAYTAMLVGGTRLFHPETRQEWGFYDDRPLAYIMLSGPGSDAGGLEPESWMTFQRPALVVGGTADPRGDNRSGIQPEWRLEPFVYGPDRDKYCALIDEAHHLTYIGPFWRPGGFVGWRSGVRRMTFGKADRERLEWVKAMTTLFWSAYLRGDASARGVLQSDAFAQVSGGAVGWSHK